MLNFVLMRSAFCRSVSAGAPQNTPSFPEPSVHLSRRETKHKQARRADENHRLLLKLQNSFTWLLTLPIFKKSLRTWTPISK